MFYWMRAPSAIGRINEGSLKMKSRHALPHFHISFKRFHEMAKKELQTSRRSRDQCWENMGATPFPHGPDRFSNLLRCGVGMRKIDSRITVALQIKKAGSEGEISFGSDAFARNQPICIQHKLPRCTGPVMSRQKGARSAAPQQQRRGVHICRIKR